MDSPYAPLGFFVTHLLGENALIYFVEIIKHNCILKPILNKRFMDDTFVFWDYTTANLIIFITQLSNAFAPHISYY